MWGRSILTILYLFVAVAYAAPSNYNSDASDQNGLVYVFNIYAVKNTKTETVGRMLTDESMIKVPSNFQPIGSILFADEDEEEPFTMNEFSEFLEEWGVTVEKMNEGDDVKVIEIKLDFSFEDFDEFMSFEEIAKLLRAEGILLDVTQENGATVVEIKFDESKNNAQDQPFTLEELGQFFEAEGFSVEYINTWGEVSSIKIHFDVPDDESRQTIAPPTTESHNERKPEKMDDRKSTEKDEKKMTKSDEKKDRKIPRDDQFFPLDFTTKSDSLNKIRRRRSVCPECKAANVIKAYVQKYEAH